MRTKFAMLALAGLAACNRPADQPKPPVTAAALAYQGADYRDQAAELAHGERLSHVLGCRGCHTATLEGIDFGEFDPAMKGIYASNLTRTIPAMTDAQLETLLRAGVHPTRGDLYIMPSEIFQRLSKADMAALIAHLRTLKPSGKPTPPPVLNATVKKQMTEGKFKPSAQWVKSYKTQVPAELGAEQAWGRYLASTTCSECHGGALEGIPDFTPDLSVASIYTDAELTRLLTEGVGKEGRKLNLMAVVGKEHFSHFTPAERAAVIAYVKARADRPQ